jgi:hypothetical protein
MNLFNLNIKYGLILVYYREIFEDQQINI